MHRQYGPCYYFKIEGMRSRATFFCSVFKTDGVFSAGFGSCFASAAAVKDEEVREHGPFILRVESHEVEFDFFRVVVFGEVEAVGNP